MKMMKNKFSSFESREFKKKVLRFARLIRIKFASFAFQLIHIVTGDIIRRTWSSIEGFRTMNARRLNRRTQVRQAA